jgi:hypothetical protein
MLSFLEIHNDNNDNIYQNKWNKEESVKTFKSNLLYNSEYMKHIYYDKKKKVYYKEKVLYFDRRKSKWFKEKISPVPVDDKVILKELVDYNIQRRKIIKELVLKFRKMLYDKISRLDYSSNINLRYIGILEREESLIRNNVNKYIKNFGIFDQKHCLEYFNKLMIIVYMKIEEIIFNKK